MARDPSLDIAVTGMAARLPGPAGLDRWWQAIVAGDVLTRRYGAEELRAAGVAADLLTRPGHVPVAGHLVDADAFDNVVFRVSPRDAQLMDPQHRLMLEVAWNALEDAASRPWHGPVNTGVFASSSSSEYLRSIITGAAVDELTLDDMLHGCEPDFLAGHLAYRLGFTGPALAVQTACSSSLVAVHLAAQALLGGDCDQALVVAAGVAHPQRGHLYLPGGIYSARGQCLPFDERADGVVTGSGVACVVLRRLADALAEGIEPYGVILGTAVNNDGSAKTGYYAPSVAGQEAVIAAALQAADVDAATIGHLETHGTGTPVGDPIEWSAASAALRGRGAATGQVAVGALKANVGHLDNAAGVTSLIKALLALRSGVIPPLAGFSRLNPLLETADSPLWVPTAAVAWPVGPVRRACVSSFGIGGTNAHVVLEQAPPPTGAGVGSAGPRLVMLSAADPAALTRSTRRLRDDLTTEQHALADVAHTLAVGRAELAERLVVTAHSAAKAAVRLEGPEAAVRGRRPATGPAPLVLLFPGQGTSYGGAATPFAVLPGFTAALHDCLTAFDDYDVAARVGRALHDRELPAAEAQATELAQPALFALGYATAAALSGLKLVPLAVVGHSLGEITAACVAGALDLGDAARFVVARGRAMQRCPEGTMLAVNCDARDLTPLLADRAHELELAAVNGPGRCVVSGTAGAVADLRSRLYGVRVTPLRTSRAFHSALVEPALPVLAAALAGVRSRPLRLALVTTADGRILRPGAVLDLDDLVAQARRPVRFGEAVAAVVAALPGAVGVETGPGVTLSTLALRSGLATTPLCAAGSRASAEDVLAALGALWASGQPLDTAALAPGGRPVHLPGYPFAGPRWTAPGRSAPPSPTPAEAATDTTERGATPSTKVYAVMAGLWREVLGETALTRESDFFALGGDSLSVSRLAYRTSERFGVAVPLRTLLACRTLGRQASEVEAIVAAGRPDTRGSGHG